MAPARRVDVAGSADTPNKLENSILAADSLGNIQRTGSDHSPRQSQVRNRPFQKTLNVVERASVYLVQRFENLPKRSGSSGVQWKRVQTFGHQFGSVRP